MTTALAMESRTRERVKRMREGVPLQERGRLARLVRRRSPWARLRRRGDPERVHRS